MIILGSENMQESHMGQEWLSRLCCCSIRSANIDILFLTGINLNKNPWMMLTYSSIAKGLSGAEICPVQQTSGAGLISNGENCCKKIINRVNGKSRFIIFFSNIDNKSINQ